MRAVCPAHLIHLALIINNIWWSVQVTKLLIMQSSPFSLFVPLQPSFQGVHAP
jgi:hypothetical protein